MTRSVGSSEEWSYNSMQPIPCHFMEMKTRHAHHLNEVRLIKFTNLEITAENANYRHQSPRGWTNLKPQISKNFPAVYILVETICVSDPIPRILDGIVERPCMDSNA